MYSYVCLNIHTTNALQVMLWLALSLYAWSQEVRVDMHVSIHIYTCIQLHPYKCMYVYADQLHHGVDSRHGLACAWVCCDCTLTSQVPLHHALCMTAPVLSSWCVTRQRSVFFSCSRWLFCSDQSIVCVCLCVYACLFVSITRSQVVGKGPGMCFPRFFPQNTSLRCC